MFELRLWARLGGWMGIAWPLLFVAIIVIASAIDPHTHSASEDLAAFGQPRLGHLNMLLHSLLAISFLLGIVWAVGLNFVLQSEKPNPAATLGAVFGVIAFVLAMAMLMVQGSVETGIAEDFAKRTSDADRAATLVAFSAVRSVDIGLDFTWDIFIAWCMILFGVAMLRTPTFGKFWGALGIVIAAVLFLRDIYSAPHPAQPDLSPISFVWFIAVSIKMLLFAGRKAPRLSSQTSAAAATLSAPSNRESI